MESAAKLAFIASKRSIVLLCKVIWSLIELWHPWGCANTLNIVIIRRFQSKIFRVLRSLSVCFITKTRSCTRTSEFLGSRKDVIPNDTRSSYPDWASIQVDWCLYRAIVDDIRRLQRARILDTVCKRSRSTGGNCWHVSYCYYMWYIAHGLGVNWQVINK